MARQKIITHWACDFETTVWGEEVEKELGRKQDHTEVWAAADVQLYDQLENVTITHSIRDFLERFLTMPGHNVLHFHNLSFDGSFIIDFLLREGYKFYVGRDRDMPSKNFQTSISRMGSWYWIKIKRNKTIIEIRNSLKLMPSSLRSIGESFQTKHQKLDMEYEGYRHAYCEITKEEEQYIKNDVLVLKEALEKMFDEGHDSLTIGSCCLKEFKSFYTKQDYNRLFPDLREYPLDHETCGYYNMWEYVHKSYNGGWCFVNPKYAHQVVGEGKVYDVNSLYPSMMHSESGNRYPYGAGQYCWGAPSQELISNTNKYYFIRIRCRFKLKPHCFPWLHIRGNSRYKGNENLYRSDIRKDGKYYRYYYDFDGNICDTKHEFILTCTDWELLQETYDLYDLEIFDHIWFWAVDGLFDEYIDKYKQIKMNNEGFLRTLAKLFLNNLYGKFSMSDDSSYKEPVLVDNEVKFVYHEEHEKKVGYIAIGSAITSYARNFTIRHAMANYDRFAYGDTDSIHLVGTEPAEMVVEHPTNFCCWKNESDFDYAYYERQKLYAEHITHVDHVPVEKPYLDIKAAGMGKDAKEQFIADGYDLHDLTVGLELTSGNLKARRIHGGILLTKQKFNIRKSVDKKVNPVYSSVCKQ